MEKIVDNISINFDINHFKEIALSLYLSHPSIYYGVKEANDRYRNTNHSTYYNEKLLEIEKAIYSYWYSGNLEKYQKRHKNQIENELDTDMDLDDTKMEEQFFTQLRFTESINDDMLYTSRAFSRIIKRHLRQLPIPTARFPHYTSQSRDYLDDLQGIQYSQKEKADETEINDIISKGESITIEDLEKVLAVLSKYSRKFPFSPSFVLSSIGKLDLLLNSLFHAEDSKQCIDILLKTRHSDEEDQKFAMTKLILLCKMHFYMLINQLHDYLVCFLQLVILHQNGFDSIDFSSINDPLPNTKERETFYGNLSFNDEFIDYVFFPDELNSDFILTKKGLFRVKRPDSQQKFNDRLDSGENFVRIPFNDPSLEKQLSKMNHNNTRMFLSLSNNILYVFSLIDKKVHLINFSQHIQNVKEELKENKKEPNNIEVDPDIVSQKKSKKEFDKANEIIQFCSVKEVDISDDPLLAMSICDNHVYIVQQKSNENKLIITVVNLFSFETNDVFESECVTQYSQTIPVENDFLGVTFFKHHMRLLLKDSTFDEYIIFNDATTTRLNKIFVSPLLFMTQNDHCPLVKFDEFNFMYVVEKYTDSIIASRKINSLSNRIFLDSDTSIFNKHPYLHQLSSLVDNCLQLVINQSIYKAIPVTYFKKVHDSDSENKVLEFEPKIKYEHSVSPNEMSSVVQTLISITRTLDEMSKLLSAINDPQLKQFFISLLFKFYGINVIYASSTYAFAKEEIDQSSFNKFVKLREFVFGILPMASETSKYSIVTQTILQQSVLTMMALSAKYLFLPNSFDQAKDLMNMVFYHDMHTEFTDYLFKQMSSLIFTRQSAWYFIDATFLDHIIKYEDVINLQKLVVISTYFLLYELKFINKCLKEDFSTFLGNSTNAVFQYLKHLISTKPIIYAEEILLTFFVISNDSTNSYYDSILFENYVGINHLLYTAIRNIDGVIENDEELFSHESDLEKGKFIKEVKILETNHPFNAHQENDDINFTGDADDGVERIHWGPKEETKEFITYTAKVDFLSSQQITVIYDQQCELPKKAVTLAIHSPENYFPDMFSGTKWEASSSYSGTSLKFVLKIDKKETIQPESCYGFKLKIISYDYQNPQYVFPNPHLLFSTLFVFGLVNSASYAICSTSISKEEKEVRFILENKLIQGIKLEDIDNYEKEQNLVPAKTTHKLKRGISRGISFDTEKSSTFDEKSKKAFLMNLLSTNDSTETLEQKFLNTLYKKTSNMNKIRLTKYTNSILDVERIFIAAMIKQLGFINISIQLIKKITTNDDFTVPNPLQQIFKMVYKLRSTLFFSYQKSKSAINNPSKKLNYNFVEYSEEIKRKCKLLLYSDPITKFKDDYEPSNDESLEQSINAIYSFVTSDILLTNISSFIDVRRARLDMSSRGINLMINFLKQKEMFKTSLQFVTKLNRSVVDKSLQDGLTENEQEEYQKTVGTLCEALIDQFFSPFSIPVTQLCDRLHSYLYSIDKDSNQRCCNKLVEVIKANEANTSYAKDLFDFHLIRTIFTFLYQSPNKQTIEYMVSLLISDKISLDCQRLILVLLSDFVDKIPDCDLLHNIKFLYSFLATNSSRPIIVKNLFYWLGRTYLQMKPLEIISSKSSLELPIVDNIFMKMTNQEFITMVLKGIGQAYIGRSSLFIDDSFQPFAHRQLAEGMISFIRLLLNNNQKDAVSILQQLLSQKLLQVNLESIGDDDFVLMGLMASIGYHLSAIDSERLSEEERLSSYELMTYCQDRHYVYCNDDSSKTWNRWYTNVVQLLPSNLELSKESIEAILQFNEKVVNSNYFENEDLDQNELCNLFITMFYSILPMVFQNEKNCGILFNDSTIDRAVSLCQIVNKRIPTNDNSLLLLPHYLERAFLHESYNVTSDQYVKDGCYRFVNMNYGEVIYNEVGNDIIRSNQERYNLYLCSRPFDFNTKTYFEVKINKIGNKNLLLGFVDSERNRLAEAYGLGSLGGRFLSRKSPFISPEITEKADWIINHQSGDSDSSSDDSDSEGDEEEEDNTQADQETTQNSESNTNEPTTHETESNNENAPTATENAPTPTENAPTENGSTPNEEEPNNDNEQNNEEETDNKEKKKKRSKKEKKPHPSIPFDVNEGDVLGCYYTPDYIYFTKNGEMVNFRTPHPSNRSYIPLIFIREDDIELELVQNVKIIKEDEFPLINTHFDFSETDLRKAVYKNPEKNPHFVKNMRGSYVFISKPVIPIAKLRGEDCSVFPPELMQYIDFNGIVKEVKAVPGNPFVSTFRIESYDRFNLSKKVIDMDIDSRFVKIMKTSFLVALENAIGVKFGYNDQYEHIVMKSPDFTHKEISSYLRKKTINENSRAISIILTKFLVFILFDYLRFIKSPFLSDDKLLQSVKMTTMIKYFAHSLLNILSFKPKVRKSKTTHPSSLTIFGRENEDETKGFYMTRTNFKRVCSEPMPGDLSYFNSAFQAFFLLSINYISPIFMKLLINEILSFKKDNKVDVESIYQSIPSVFRFESFLPGPTRFSLSKEYEPLYRDIIACEIPVLVSSIPKELPSLTNHEMKIRSADIIHSFEKNRYSVTVKWKYDLEKITKLIQKKEIESTVEDAQQAIRNYQMKFALMIITKLPQEILLNSELGLVHVFFHILQLFNASTELFEQYKDSLYESFERLISFSFEYNPITATFLQMIIIELSSHFGLPQSFFDLSRISNPSSIFARKPISQLTINSFPNRKNSSSLIMMIHSILGQAHISEIQHGDSSLADLFEDYHRINNELLTVGPVNQNTLSNYSEYDTPPNSGSRSWRRRHDDDDDKPKRTKNPVCLLLSFFFSQLLCADPNLPIPNFIFEHEWCRQHFHGFNFSVDVEDMTKQDKCYQYKTDVFENEFDMKLSYDLTTILANQGSSDDEFDDSSSDDSDDGDDDDDDFGFEHSGLTVSDGPMIDLQVSDGLPVSSNDEIGVHDEEVLETNQDHHEEEISIRKKPAKEKPDKKKKKKSKEELQSANVKIIVHQLKDNRTLYLSPKVKSAHVQFPCQIEILVKSKYKDKLPPTSVFVFGFSPEYEDEKSYFIEHHDKFVSDYKQFVSLAKYDKEFSERILANKEKLSNQESHTDNSENEEEDSDLSTTENEDSKNDKDENEDEKDENENDKDEDEKDDNENEEENENEDNDSDNNHSEEEDNVDILDFFNTFFVPATKQQIKVENFYTLNKIPLQLSEPFESIQGVPEDVICLRMAILERYRDLVEEVFLSYTKNDDDDDDDNEGANPYLTQLIKPAYSMKTELKFKFLSTILNTMNSESDNQLNVIFNRFEQQKFMDQFLHETNGTGQQGNNDNISSDTHLGNINHPRSFLEQFMEQVGDDLLGCLRQTDRPFRVTLVGEGAIDAGGPSRDIFSSIIIELMNEHIGVFTFNPNRRNHNKDTNQEDLIPNSEFDQSNSSQTEFKVNMQMRFKYAGALIATSITSSLPQPMKLAAFIWDYLITSRVAIEEIYAIDDEFKQVIRSLEVLDEIDPETQKSKAELMSEEEFESQFGHNFEVKNSFGKSHELIPNGSKKKVTKDNRHEFISLAKEFRLHEFDSELSDLKSGFDKVLSSSNLLNILRPSELKLLACGEEDCEISRMKEMIEVQVDTYNNDDLDEDSIKETFWSAMSKLTVPERMAFIKFASGNLSLPAPGLKWESNITIDMKKISPTATPEKKMIIAHTCHSSVDCPIYDTEEELIKNLKISINFSGLITDSHENFEEIIDFL